MVFCTLAAYTSLLMVQWLMLHYLLLEQAASEEVDSLHFSFYSDDEIKRISIKKITKLERLDAKNLPVPGGLLDPAMGPINDTDT